MFLNLEQAKARTARFHLVWMWSICLLGLNVVAWFRFYVVPGGAILGERLPMGLIALLDPEPSIGGYCRVEFGTYFRLMHDLASLPFLAAYLVGLAFMHWRLLARSGQQRRVEYFAVSTAILFALFFLAYVVSLDMPVRSLGVRLR